MGHFIGLCCHNCKPEEACPGRHPSRTFHNRRPLEHVSVQLGMKELIVRDLKDFTHG